MTKRICDRCGKDIERAVGASFTFHLDLKECSLTGTKGIELCDSCEKELYKWLENEETHECKCDKNVIELLDLIECHEKKICEQSGKIEQLERENAKLKDGAVQDLLKRCSVKFELKFEDEEGCESD